MAMNDGVPALGWLIGTVCYVDQEKIRLRASLSDFSDRMLNGEPRHINGLNQYLYAHLGITTRIVFKVSSVEEAEKPFIDDPSSRYDTSYFFTAVPIGEIEGSRYIPGVIDLPMVGTNVYACDESILMRIFCGRGGVEVGTLAGYDSIRPTFDIDALFSAHLAILGNTGSGKSTTARLLFDKTACLIEEGNEIKKRALFVVFDLHGDYEFLAKKNLNCVHRIASDEYHLAPGELTIDDWSAILDPSRRIQKPLLERAVKYSCLSEAGKLKLYAAFAFSAIRDTSADSHAARKFQIAKYYQVIEDFLDLRGAHHNAPQGYQIKSNRYKKAGNAHDLLEFFNLDYGNIPEGLTDDLEAVLRNFIEDTFMDNQLPDIELILKSFKKPSNEVTIDDVVGALDFVFDEEEVRGNHQARSYSEGLVTQLQNLRERYADNLFSCQVGSSVSDCLRDASGLVILDVSQVVDETGLKLFSNFVARSLFQRNRNSDPSLYRSRPIYLVFDEAHRYIRDADLTDDSIFNRIAREGRKFGVYLTVISQIPSELSRVILSQVGTFIIHRIQNSYDLDYVRRNVPAITYSQVMRLPSFAPGTAAALGSALVVPLEIQIDSLYANETPSVSMKTRTNCI